MSAADRRMQASGFSADAGDPQLRLFSGLAIPPGMRESAVGDRVRYVWRTITTPQAVHYRMIALPDALTFGYVAVKLVHDFLLLPLWLQERGGCGGAPTPGTDTL